MTAYRPTARLLLLSIVLAVLLTEGDTKAKRVDRKNDESKRGTSGFVPARGTLEKYLECDGLNEEACKYVKENKPLIHRRKEEKQKPNPQMEEVMQAIKEDLRHRGRALTKLSVGECEELMTPKDVDRAARKMRQKRKVTDFSEYYDEMWDVTAPIPYGLDSTYTYKNMLVIRKAIKFWENETCVRFAETNPSLLNSDAIMFINSGSHCFSYAGKLSAAVSDGNPQPIKMTQSCLNVVGTAIHEIMHALGSYHEHQQLNRDDHVILYPGNTVLSEADWNQNYGIMENDVSLGLDYDFNSVMQYSGTAFSVNPSNLLTLWPSNRKYIFNMGQRATGSFMDAQVINKLYCSSICEGISPPPCQNGGYQDPNNCNWCKCRPEWSGQNCTEVPLTGSTGCAPSSGLVSISGSQEQCIQIGFRYKVGDSCRWHLEAPSGCRLKMWFINSNEFPLHMPSNELTCLHWLELKYKSSHDLNGVKFCWYNWGHTINNPMISDSNKAYAIFDAHDMYGWDPLTSHMQGFKLCAAIDSC